MQKLIGIWVDHEKALLVTLSNGSETIARIDSDVEKKVRLSGGSRSSTPYGPQDVASERKVQQRRRQQLSHYYKEIAKSIASADEILVLGPGEAKIELRKELEKSETISSKIAAVETADKMTNKTTRRTRQKVL